MSSWTSVTGTAGADLLARADDRSGDVRGQQAEVPVGLGGSLLDRGRRGDQVGEPDDGRPGDRQVPHGPHGVHAVAGVGGHLLVSDQAVLDAWGLSHLLLLVTAAGRKRRYRRVSP
ncbi:hypothetical protein ACWZEH_17965 [Streptomyces sp. QTS137]